MRASRLVWVAWALVGVSVACAVLDTWITAPAQLAALRGRLGPPRLAAGHPGTGRLLPDGRPDRLALSPPPDRLAALRRQPVLHLAGDRGVRPVGAARGRPGRRLGRALGRLDLPVLRCAAADRRGDAGVPRRPGRPPHVAALAMGRPGLRPRPAALHGGLSDPVPPGLRRRRPDRRLRPGSPSC